MKLVVKIDRRSIRKNPNVGLDRYYIPGPWYSTPNGGKSRQIQLVTSMGCEPEYLYDYIPCRIPCSNCNTSFVHTELVDNTYYNEDEDEYYEVTCCPHCGHEIEHTLQFEKLIN